MKYLYQITLDDYIKAYELAKSRGKQPGESMEAELIEVLKKSGQVKKLGATEMTPDELMRDSALKGKKVLGIETTKDGKTKFKFTKPKE